MSTFGELLRFHRRQCRDPDRGGMLTQARLGELIGLELGDAGYAGAAVSYWEQDETKISEDARLVLVSLISVLHQCSGLSSLEEANELLRAGNYRALNIEETSRVFPDAVVVSSDAGYPTQIHPSNDLQKPSSQDLDAREPGPQQTTESRKASVSGQARRKQLILLNKVNNFWVEGVLEHSTRDVKLIDLTWQPQSEAVEQPWKGIIDSAAYSQLEQTDAASVENLFNGCDRSLLILGSPGAGKTTLLLMLARDLVARAREDPNQPIPVVLSLVSWETSHGPLADWIVDELTAKYQIPRQLGRTWLEKDQLVLLLDGYDEVRDGRRQECAREINNFRQTQGLTGIAVCSRTERYEAIPLKLNFSAAILLDPLTTDQVDDYLAAAGTRLTVLRGTMERDRTVREMARSPLMLSVMGAAYSDVSGIRTSDVSEFEGSAEKPARSDTVRRRDIGRQNELFEAYIRKMFDRYGGDPAYPPELTVKYLSWLARKLPEHNMNVFLIEQMQPSWLPTLRRRRTYILNHGLVVGFVAGIILSLFLVLINPRNPKFMDGLFAPLVEQISIPRNTGVFLALMIGNLFLGLVSSAISGFYMERYERRELEGTSKNRLRWQRIVITGVVIGFLTIVLLIPFGMVGLGTEEPGMVELAIAWSVAEIIVYMVVARYIHGQSYDRDIRAMESISWSLRHAVEILIVGALLGWFVKTLGEWITGGEHTANTIIIFALGGFLLGGMRGSRVEKKNRSNEGILLALRNATIAALLTGPVLGALVWFYYGWEDGLIMALIMILAVFSLLGGSTVTKHLLLRTLLRGERYGPWRYARFLDHTCRLVFLRKVGGGYIFMHRSLQDYFAALRPAPPSQPLQDDSLQDFIIRDTLPGTNL